MKDDADLTMAETLLERLGGALTVDDILILRAAAVWHRIQWELRSEREDGVSGRQRAPVISPAEKRALTAVGMPQRPAREPGGNAYVLDPAPVQEFLDRAEVATGYLCSLHGIPAEAQEPSYPNFDYQPGLGPMAVMTVWERIGNSDPALVLTEAESLWT